MKRATFMIEDDVSAAMQRRPGVDWDAVVSGAIRFKLKMLRQGGKPDIATSMSHLPVARPAQLATVASSRPRREVDPSPAEIARRAAEVRAARVS